MTELLIGFILICIILGAVLAFSLGCLIGSTIYISYLERRKRIIFDDIRNKNWGLDSLELRKNYKSYNEEPNKNFKI